MTSTPDLVANAIDALVLIGPDNPDPAGNAECRECAAAVDRCLDVPVYVGFLEYATPTRCPRVCCSRSCLPFTHATTNEDTFYTNRPYPTGSMIRSGGVSTAPTSYRVTPRTDRRYAVRPRTSA